MHAILRRNKRLDPQLKAPRLQCSRSRPAVKNERELGVVLHDLARFLEAEEVELSWCDQNCKGLCDQNWKTGGPWKKEIGCETRTCSLAEL